MKDFLIRHKWALIIGSTAVIVRLIYLIELSLHPGFDLPMVDEKWHWEWANDIIYKSFWGESAYFRAPLYPYFLAFLSWVTSGSVFWSKFLQILLSFGTGIFIYRLGKNLFGQRAGIVAGFMYAAYGTIIFYETMFLIPALFLFFLCWGLYRLVEYRESVSFKEWLITGLIFGLAAISRPNVLLVMPFLALWLFWMRRQMANRADCWRLPIAMFVGVMIAIVPVTVRNLAVTGEMILISSQGGINLYLGNNESADGLTMLMPDVDLDESVSWRQFGSVTHASAEKQTGTKLTESEASSFWTGKALTFIVNNPGKFASLVWRKTTYLLSGFENSDNTDIYYQRNKSVMHSLLVWDNGLRFPFGLLLPLTILGIWVLRSDRRKLAPLYVFLIAYIPTIVLFLVTARHRLPLLPIMLVLSAGGLVRLKEQLPKLRSKEMMIGIALVIIPAIVFNMNWFDLGHSNNFQVHFNAGIKFQRLNDWVNAEKEFALADQEYAFSPTLINNLGYARYQTERYGDAAVAFERAIALKPDLGRAYNNYGLVMRKLDNMDSARSLYGRALDLYKVPADNKDVSQTWRNLAKLYEARQQVDSAVVAWNNAIAANPQLGQNWFSAAGFHARYESYDICDSFYVEGMHRHELGGIDFFNWGLSLLERKRYSEGIGTMLRGLRKDETMYQAYYCIAIAYLENSAPPDTTIKYVSLSLKYNPEYKPALELKQIMLEKGVWR